MEQFYFFILILLGVDISFNKVKGFQAEKIVGGIPAVRSQFKYTVAVIYDNRNPCSGGILDDWHIITAAHCFYNKETNEVLTAIFTIAVEAIDLRQPSRSTRYIDVTLIYIPKDYISTRVDTYSTKGDLAIVKVKSKFGLEFANHPHVRRLQLPSETLTDVKMLLTVTGYGWNEIDVYTDEEDNNFDDFEYGSSDGKLRFSYAHLVNHSDCERIIEDTIPKSNICAKVDGTSNIVPKGICRFDSGAPLVHKQVLHGIAVNGFMGCDEYNMPGIYTNVYYYKSIIETVLFNSTNSDMIIIEQKEIIPGVYVLQ